MIHKQLGGGGGMEQYFTELCRRLVDSGHDVHVITSKIVLPASEAGGLRIHRVSYGGPIRSARLLSFNYRAKITAAEIGADVTLGFGRTTDQDIHRAGGGCHRVYSRMLPAWKRLSLSNQIDLELERRLYTNGRTSRFVVNTSKVARELQTEYGIDPSRIVKIRTPVDTNRFQPRQQELGGDPLRFLFVSLDHKRKGLEFLLDIWTEVNAQLLIAGTPLNASQRRRIKALGARARFLGHVDDMVDLYRSAHAFIHTSLYDACANTVLQAMSSGLPVIVSARDGAVEFIEQGINGFRLENPKDRNALLDLVRRVIRMDPDEREKLGARARHSVIDQSWSHHVREWISLAESVAK
ncbi:glycosyltransferase family 4 protein [Pseudomonadota bacterium]